MIFGSLIIRIHVKGTKIAKACGNFQYNYKDHKSQVSRELKISATN